MISSSVNSVTIYFICYLLNESVRNTVMLYESNVECDDMFRLCLVLMFKTVVLLEKVLSK